MLDALDAAAQDEHRDGQRGHRTARLAGDAGQLERGGDAGQVRARRADVRRHENEQARRGHAHAVALADQSREALADVGPCAAGAAHP